MTRFSDIDLSALPVPDALATPDFEAELESGVVKLDTSLTAAGHIWDTKVLETDPLVVTIEHQTSVVVTKTAEINDAVRSTLLATAHGAFLDHKAAELGVERKILVEADPSATPPVEQVMESDQELRRRRQLAPEALSTAGPAGAYPFFAMKAHPHALDCAEFDPHSGLCAPGEMLLVIASVMGDGVPTDLVMDSVAEYLDARIIRYAVAPVRTREITRKQKLRPMTDKVIVEACSAVTCSISVVLKVQSGPSPEIVVEEARRRLNEYLASRRKIGVMISDSAVAAAVHVATLDGRSGS